MVDVSEAGLEVESGCEPDNSYRLSFVKFSSFHLAFTGRQFSVYGISGNLNPN